jgi:hypothetical protein
MMIARSMNDLYWNLFQLVKRDGMVMHPRGFTCHELRPWSFQIDRLSEGLYTGRSRRMSTKFLAIETLGYLAGLGGPGDEWFAKLLISANPGMSSFQNPDTQRFDGAYGPRIRRSLKHVCDQLCEDPWTRQAIVSIWDTGPFPKSKDTPCTVMLHFYKANADPEFHELGMTVYMRSNDLNWGTVYDVPAFCSVGLAIASDLGWADGPYTHVAGSLHYYDQTSEDGPRPPTIASIKQEQFVSLMLPMPQLLGIMDIIDGAQRFLEQVNDQRMNRIPWHLVTPAIEGTNPYWKVWGSLLRWRWKQDSSQVAFSETSIDDLTHNPDNALI